MHDIIIKAQQAVVEKGTNAVSDKDVLLAGIGWLHHNIHDDTVWLNAEQQKRHEQLIGYLQPRKEWNKKLASGMMLLGAFMGSAIAAIILKLSS